MLARLARPHLVLLPIALLATACPSYTEVSRVTGMSTSELKALAGAPVLLRVSIAGDCWHRCQERGEPVVELASGAPLPTTMRAQVTQRIGSPTYIIDNPSTDPPFPQEPVPPLACPGWEYAPPRHAVRTVRECEVIGFEVRVVAAPEAPAGPVPLRLRIPACGEVLEAPFTFELVGVAPGPGVCAPSTASPCQGDEECIAQECNDARVTCHGVLDEVPGSSPDCEPEVLAGPAGVACGCVAGICTWH